MAHSFTSQPMTLKPEWIDYNGHLNMAYYGRLFDDGVEEYFTKMGIGEDYARSSGHTTYSAEFRIRYLRELPPDAVVRVTFRILDLGPKSLHYAQEILHEDGWVSATGEGIGLHIDQSGPRVAAYPEEVAARLAAEAEAHAAEPVPEWVGAPMKIRK